MEKPVFLHLEFVTFSRRCFPEVGRTALWPAISYAPSIARAELGRSRSFCTLCPYIGSLHSTE